MRNVWNFGGPRFRGCLHLFEVKDVAKGKGGMRGLEGDGVGKSHGVEHGDGGEKWVDR